MLKALVRCLPFPSDEQPNDPIFGPGDDCFLIEYVALDVIVIYDQVQGFDAPLHVSQLRGPNFSVEQWFAELCACNSGLPSPRQVA